MNPYRSRAGGPDIEDAFEITAPDGRPVDIPQRETGAIDDARRKTANAVTETVKLLKVAQASLEAGTVVPNVVDEAMHRYFLGTELSQINELIERIEPMARWIMSFPVEEIDAAADFDNKVQQGETAKAIAKRVPAMAFPEDKADDAKYRPTIALFPRWYEAGEEHLQPTRLLHEAFHFAYTDVRHHPRDQRWRNAFAYQGLVSKLGGLPIGEKLAGMF